jgi:hypothetical protein
MTPVFEEAKTVHAFDLAASVIGDDFTPKQKMPLITNINDHGNAQG